MKARLHESRLNDLHLMHLIYEYIVCIYVGAYDRTEIFGHILDMRSACVILTVMN